MRVLFLSTWFPYPTDNGSKLRVYYLLRALAQSHEVTLVSFSFGTAKPHEPSDLNTWCQSIYIVPVNPFSTNQTGTLKNFLSPRPGFSRPIPLMSRLVTEVIQSTGFDVIIASTEVMADYALLLNSGTIKILEEHNSMTHWAIDRYKDAVSPFQRLRCWLSLQKRRRFEARCYPLFDLVTMVSEIDRQTTLNTIGSEVPHVALIPNGVDTGYNQPGLIPVNNYQLVYNGALTYTANYDAVRYFLADIYPSIKSTLPDVSLVITGSTEGVDLTSLALDDSVQFTGYVDDVRFPVAAAAVCVTPILQGSGTRLKILEAMALGTPIVATTKAAEGLNVVNGEHLLLADDPGSFATLALDLLQNTQLRERLTVNARCLVENEYDWDEIGRKFVALVEQIVAQKP